MAGCPGALVSAEAGQGEHVAASLSCRLSALRGRLGARRVGLPALAESAPWGLVLGGSEGGRDASKTALWAAKTLVEIHGLTSLKSQKAGWSNQGIWKVKGKPQKKAKEEHQVLSVNSAQISS